MVWSYEKRQCVWCQSLDVSPTCQRLWRCCIRFLTLYTIHPKLTEHEEMWVLFAHAHGAMRLIGYYGILWWFIFFILYLRKVHQFLIPWGIIYMQKLNLLWKHLHKRAHIFEPMFNKLLNVVRIITEIILTPVIPPKKYIF